MWACVHTLGRLVFAPVNPLRSGAGNELKPPLLHQFPNPPQSSPILPNPPQSSPNLPNPPQSSPILHKPFSLCSTHQIPAACKCTHAMLECRYDVMLRWPACLKHVCVNPSGMVVVTVCKKQRPETMTLSKCWWLCEGTSVLV